VSRSGWAPGRPVLRVALALSVAGIAVLAFSPLPAPPGPEGIDKLQHAAAFALLAALAEGAYPGRQIALARWGLLFGYGLSIEAVQALLPYRDASAADLIANAIGILSYVLGSALLRAGLARRDAVAAAAQSRGQ